MLYRRGDFLNGLRRLLTCQILQLSKNWLYFITESTPITELRVFLRQIDDKRKLMYCLYVLLRCWFYNCGRLVHGFTLEYYD